MPTGPLQFACPHCGGKKVWKPEIAGKRAKCSCGQVISIPAQVPGAPPPSKPPASFEEAFDAAQHDGGDDLVAPETSAHPPRGTAFVPPPVVIEREEADGSVSTVSGGPRHVVHSQNPALMHRKGLKPEPKAAEEAPAVSALRDYILPPILIAAGIALCFLDGTYQGGGAWKPVNQVIGSIIVNMVAGLVIAIAAVVGASAMGGIAFQERIPLVMFKLCGVALAPEALGSLAAKAIGDFNGDMAGVFISLGCVFLLFFLLFRLSMQDQVVCALLLWIIRAGVKYVIFRYQGFKGGSEI